MKHLKKYEGRYTRIGIGDYLYSTQGLDKMDFQKIKSSIIKVASPHGWEMEFYLTKRFPEETKKEIQEFIKGRNMKKGVDELYKIRFAKEYLKVINEGGFINLKIDLTDNEKQIIEDVKMEIETNKYNL